LKSAYVKGRKPTSREVALKVLARVEEDHSYSNLLLNRELQQSRLARPDAALATELVYGTIQRQNTIDYFLADFVRQGIDKLQPWVRSLLRLSFYQLYYLDRIPAHAAVHEAVEIAKRRGHAGIAGLVNAVLRGVLRRRGELEVPQELPPIRRISLRHSHPEWLVARWIRQYGESEAEQMCAANNEPPLPSARVNLRRHTRDELVRLLREDGFEAAPSPLAPAGLTARGNGSLALTRWYSQGDLTIQDESSMLVAEVAAPLPGMRVLDCCAAPGGKTTHLAEKMDDLGEVWACDLHPHKGKLIEEQAKRLGLTSIRIQISDARRLGDCFARESFDRILLDAPCSGLGVIRRKPEIKWSKTEADITAISRIQRDILEAVHPLLKPGGLLVYSTCTVAREENEAAIEAFLQSHPEFSPAKEAVEGLPGHVNEAFRQQGWLQILPHQHHSDGFFIARLRKNPSG